ncbi:ROK family transcriptional regulator [Butyrivibrio sp. VCB2006]|uniref:ROK family transcriptional regulator n=1 Tax=Butyrivibrio sp. VCB2006 TaxID=1280679 RepID=UPI0004187BD3|nr:ROK family transcriptional regulator [Butyrivibrio sp. VCB2006]
MRKEGINLEQVKKENKSLIIKCISSNGPMSRKDIASKTSLTAASVTQITTSLIEDGILKELGACPESTGAKGRKKVLLDINYEKGFVCAISIEVEKTTIAICNLRGDIVQSIKKEPCIKEFKTQKKLKPQLFLHDICQETLGLFQSLSDEYRNKLGCISVSIPGLVDKESGISTHAYGIWDSPVPIKEMLSGELPLGVPIIVENNVDAFATAEILFGAGRTYDSLLVIKWGPGVGSTIVVDSKVYQGRHGKTAELGHFIIDKDGPLCSCGRRGCLETYLSSGAFGSLLPVDDSLDIFARSIVNACTIIAPNRIVLYGGLFKDADIREKLISACTSYDPSYNSNRLIYTTLSDKESYIGPVSVYSASALF